LGADCRANELTLTEVVDGLVAQLLFQVSAEFEAPPWLLDAVESGALPIGRCSNVVPSDVDEEDEPCPENLIRFGR